MSIKDFVLSMCGPEAKAVVELCVSTEVKVVNGKEVIVWPLVVCYGVDFGDSYLHGDHYPILCPHFKKRFPRIEKHSDWVMPSIDLVGEYCALLNVELCIDDKFRMMYAMSSILCVFAQLKDEDSYMERAYEYLHVYTNKLGATDKFRLVLEYFIGKNYERYLYRSNKPSLIHYARQPGLSGSMIVQFPVGDMGTWFVQRRVVRYIEPPKSEDKVEFVAQSGKYVSQEAKSEWKEERLPFEPNVIGKYLSTLGSKLKSKVASVFSGWWSSIAGYVELAKAYMSSKKDEVVDGSVTAVLKGLWKKAYNYILVGMGAALVGLAWHFRAKLKSFFDNVVSLFTHALSVFGDLFVSFGSWFKGMFDHLCGSFCNPFARKEDSTPSSVNSQDGVEAQSGVAAVAATLGAVAGFIAEKHDSKFVPSFQNFAKIAKTIIPMLAVAKVASDGLAKIFDWLPQVLQDTLYYLFGITGSHVSPGLRGLITRAESVIKCYTSKVDGVNVLNGELVLDVGLDTSLARETIIVSNGLRSCLSEDIFATGSKAINSYAQSLIRSLEPFVDKAQTVLGTGNTRPEPIGLYIFGVSGVGKSSNVPALASAIFPNARPEELYYSKNVTEQFNSRYNQQLVFLIDDYGTATGANSVTPTQDMLRYISSTAAYMNMAAINEKGKQFASKVVALTTNLSPRNVVEGISNPDAFHERFIHLEQIVAEDYATKQGRIDLNKIANITAADGLMPHIRYRLWRPVFKGETRSFEFEYTKIELSFEECANFIRGAIASSEARYYQKKRNEAAIREACKRINTPLDECIEMFRRFKCGATGSLKDPEGPEVNDDDVDKVLGEKFAKELEAFKKKQDEELAKFVKADSSESVSFSEADLKLEAPFETRPKKDLSGESCCLQAGLSREPPLTSPLLPPHDNGGSSKNFGSKERKRSVADVVADITNEYQEDVLEFQNFVDTAYRPFTNDEAVLAETMRMVDQQSEGLYPQLAKDKQLKCFYCKGPHASYFCHSYVAKLGSKDSYKNGTEVVYSALGVLAEDALKVEKDPMFVANARRLTAAYYFMKDCQRHAQASCYKKEFYDMWFYKCLLLIKYACPGCWKRPANPFVGFCATGTCAYPEKYKQVLLKGLEQEDPDVEVEVEAQCGKCAPGTLVCPYKCTFDGCSGFRLPHFEVCIKHVDEEPCLKRAMSVGENTDDLKHMYDLAVKLGQSDIAKTIKAKLSVVSGLPKEMVRACQNLRLYAQFPSFVADYELRPGPCTHQEVEKLMAAHLKYKDYWTELRCNDSRTWFRCYTDWCQSGRDLFAKNGNKMLKIVAAIGVACLAFKGAQALFGLFDVEKKEVPQVVVSKDEAEIVRQSWDPNELEQGRFVRSNKADWLRRQQESDDRVETYLKGDARYYAQAGSWEDEAKIIRKNMVHIHTDSSFVWGVVVTGTCAVFPLHVFMEDGKLIGDGSKIEVKEFDIKYSTAFKKKNMTVIESNNGMHVDLCLYDFGLVMQMKKDITNRFMNNDWLVKLGSAKARFVGMEEDEEMLVSLSVSRQEYSYTQDAIAQFYLAQSWTYGPKKEGDCGKLLVIKAPGGEYKIVGFHIASKRVNGAFSSGMACVLDSEVIRGAMNVQKPVLVRQAGKELPNGCVVPEQVVPVKHPEKEVVPDCDLRLVGRLPGVGFMDGRFQWRGLPYLAEEWHTKEWFPAVTGTRHPLVRGLTPKVISHSICERVHHSTKTGLLPQHIVETAARSVFDRINVLKPEREVRAMSLEEMINGRGGLAPMSMNSAPGKFHDARRPPHAVGKRYMFSEADKDGKRTITDPILLETIEANDALIRAGVVPTTLWTFITKVEQRAVQKVLEAKTRGVIGSPTDYTMLCRKYFGALTDHVYSNPLKFGVAVGMNVYSSDWDEMIGSLMKVSSKGMDGDYSAWERYMNGQIIGVILEGVEAWYEKWTPGGVPEGDRNARYVLVYIMLHAQVLVGDLVFAMWCMMPSGDFKTTLFNSIGNLILFKTAYLLCTAEKMPKFSTVDHCDRLTKAFTFGDDLIAAISEILRGIFGVYEMSVVLAKYNITFTAGDKKQVGETAVLKDILTCEFLKHTSKVRKNVVPGMVYFPIALEESLLKTLSYSHSSLGVMEATLVNGNDVLSRVWSSGKSRFELWRERIWSVWRRCGLQEVPLCYADVETRWLNGDLTSATLCDFGKGGFSYAWVPNIVNTDDGAKWIAQSGKVSLEMPIEPALVPTEATPLVSLGDSSADTKTDGFVERVPSIGTLIKLKAKFFGTSGNLTVGWIDTPIAGVLSANVTDTIWSDSGEIGEGTTSAGLLRYFAQAYRTWCGNMRFHMFSNRDFTLSAAYVPDMVRTHTSLGIANYDWPTMTRGCAVAFGEKTLDVQVPYISRYPLLRVPWFTGEAFSDTSSPGVIGLDWTNATTVGLTNSQRITVMAGAADGFRFANLCRIPSLRVCSAEQASYPHSGGTPADIPEFIKLKPGVLESGYDLGLTQELVDGWAPIRASTLPATGTANCTAFTVSSANLTDSVLRALAYDIEAGQVRNVLTGVTAEFDIVQPVGTIVAVPWTYTISATPLEIVSDPVTTYNAVGTGTTYTFVDQWGISNKLATVWTVHDENRKSWKWRSYAGIPQGSILVANNDSKTVQLPMTAVYSTAGYTLQRFSNGQGVQASGFGAPTLEVAKSVVVHDRRIQHPKHERKRDDFVYVAQSGSMPIIGGMVKTTDGGVQTKPNVLTMGEDVPSNIGLVMKEQLVETLVWNTGSAVGHPLAYYEAPFDLIKSVVMRSAFSRYTYWRGDVTLRVQMQSNTFMNGSIILSWMPMCNSGQTLAINTGNLRSLSVTKHAIMYAGACSTVELTVPYVHNKTHLDLRVPTDDNLLGTFGIYVQNALRAGPTATSTSVSLTVFASFSNCDFAVINPTLVSIVAQGGIQSKVTNINIEHAASATVDASSIGDAFSGGSTTAPMDLPNVGLNWTPVVERKYPVICNTANIEYCTVLNTSASTRPLTKAVDTGTSQDEMSIPYLTQKLSFVESFTLSTTRAIGESLYIADLCPAAELFSMPYGSSFTPTLLSYISFPFSFWKGSLVYKVVAVASPIHTARLQICSHVGYEAAGLTVDEAFGQYTCIFEVRGVSEITLSFPWRSPTEWKKVNTGSNTDTTNYSMGQFSIRVLNPLQSMEAVSTSIDFNVYYAGGSDFELAHIGNNATDLCPVEAPM
jgi:hypothetical protein